MRLPPKKSWAAAQALLNSLMLKACFSFRHLTQQSICFAKANSLRLATPFLHPGHREEASKICQGLLKTSSQRHPASEGLPELLVQEGTAP